jgi:hypothetical protein
MKAKSFLTSLGIILGLALSTNAIADNFYGQDSTETKVKSTGSKGSKGSKGSSSVDRDSSDVGRGNRSQHDTSRGERDYDRDTERAVDREAGGWDGSDSDSEY